MCLSRWSKCLWLSSSQDIVCLSQSWMSSKSLSLNILEVFEPAKYAGGLGLGYFEGVKKFQSWVGRRGRGEGCLAPGKYLETALTFDPWKLLLFFGSEKVDVSELLGSVGSFRCWPNREVEPSCITITCQRNSNKSQWSEASLLSKSFHWATVIK